MQNTDALRPKCAIHFEEKKADIEFSSPVLVILGWNSTFLNSPERSHYAARPDTRTTYCFFSSSLIHSPRSPSMSYVEFATWPPASRSQPHVSAYSGSSSPRSIWTTYLPMTGKNFQAWKEPPVAMKRFLHRGWWVMRKSCRGVVVSLARR